MSGPLPQVRILWYRVRKAVLVLLATWSQEGCTRQLGRDLVIMFPALLSLFKGLDRQPVWTDMSSPMPCRVQSCSGTCPVELQVSPRTEITQHLQTSWGQFHLSQWLTGQWNTWLSSHVSHWSLCPCWAWELWQYMLWQSLWELWYQLTSLLKNVTSFNRGLKEEFCVCAGLILIPADWILWSQPRNGCAGNCNWIL